MAKMKTKNISDDNNAAIIRLNKCLSQSLALFDPPKQISVSQWAKENRILTDNAEAGPWRNERTPYLVEPMDAYSDHRINRIILVACSQAGKSEMILNCIGYTIDNDPCVMMLVEPTLGQVKKFSKLRITPLLKNTKCLKKKIRKLKSTAKVNNTVLEKEFPGHGMEYAEKIRDYTIAIYKKCAEYAKSKGIIIADTKFEFGVDEEGNIVIGDEMLTPDSSRFWPLEGYEAGHGQPSYDKQFVRDWLKANPDKGYKLPQDIIDKTIAKYKEAYQKLTGKAFN